MGVDTFDNFMVICLHLSVMKACDWFIYHLSTSIIVGNQLFILLINIMLIICKVNNFLIIKL